MSSLPSLTNKAANNNAAAGRSDFFEAATRNDVSVIDQYLTKFPEQVDTVGWDKWTALHQAANFGHLESVECLLRFGANPYAKDCYGRTPAHYAEVHLHFQLAQYP